MLFSYASIHEMMLCQWLYTSDKVVLLLFMPASYAKSISRLLNSMVTFSVLAAGREVEAIYILTWIFDPMCHLALFIKFRSDQKSMKMIWTNDKPSLWSGDCDHLHGLEIFCYDQSISSVISKTCVAESWNTRLASIACTEIVWFVYSKNYAFLPFIWPQAQKNEKNYLTWYLAIIDTLPFNFCITQLHAVDA